MNGKRVGCHGRVRYVTLVWWQAKDNSSLEWTQLTQGPGAMRNACQYNALVVALPRHNEALRENHNPKMADFAFEMLPRCVAQTCQGSRTANGSVIWCLDSLGEHGYLHIHHAVCLKVPGVACWLFRETEKPGKPLYDMHRSDRRTFGFGAVPCFCYRARSSCGGEAVYPCGCREIRCATLCVGIEVFCCPQDKPASVGA